MAIQSSPSVMANSLMSELNIGAFGLSIIAALYFLSYSLMQIPAGYILDHFPIKSMLTFALLFCVAGCIIFVNSNSIFFLSMARFLMGFGSCFAFISVLVCASEWFEAKYFAILVAIAESTACIGGMVGDYPLSVLVRNVGWRDSMSVFVFVGITLIILCLLFVKNVKQKSFTRFDIVGIHSSLIMILKEHQSWWIFIYTFCAWVPIVFFVELWGVPFLMVKLNITTVLGSKVLLFSWLGVIAASLALGWLSEKINQRRSLMIFCALIGVISSLGILFFPNLPLMVYMALFALLGVCAAGQTLSFVMIHDLFSSKGVIGAGIGYTNMAVVLGGLLIQPLGGLLIEQHAKITHHSDIYTLADYQFSLTLVPIFLLIAVLVGIFLLKETYSVSQ